MLTRQPRSTPSRGEAESRSTWLTSSVSLSTISRTVSLSFQSAFHLSLTVLVCYRSLVVIQPWMPFTTHFGLQSQTTRLPQTLEFKEWNQCESMGLSPSLALIGKKDPFQRTRHTNPTLSRSKIVKATFHFYLKRDSRPGLVYFPVHSPLLRESLLVSFSSAYWYA